MAVTRPLTVTSRIDSSSMPPALTPLASPSKWMATVVSMVSSRRISWRSTWTTLLLTRSSVELLDDRLVAALLALEGDVEHGVRAGARGERLAQRVRLDGDEDGVLAVPVEDARDEPGLAHAPGGA